MNLDKPKLSQDLNRVYLLAADRTKVSWIDVSDMSSVVSSHTFSIVNGIALEVVEGETTRIWVTDYSQGIYILDPDTLEILDSITTYTGMSAIAHIPNLNGGGCMWVQFWSSARHILVDCLDLTAKRDFTHDEGDYLGGIEYIPETQMIFPACQYHVCLDVYTGMVHARVDGAYLYYTCGSVAYSSVYKEIYKSDWNRSGFMVFK